ncbi:MAG TPA: hypothetical protein PKE45_25940 [Caldilineaceae bacterium]|nr:hypothetical protein [Caldilineaceae bacterium]
MPTKSVIHFATVELLRQRAHQLYLRGELASAQHLAALISDLVKSSGSPPLYADTFWGSCPFCGDSEEVLSIGAKRYAFCHEHRLYWFLGTNFLSPAEPIATHLEQTLLSTYTNIPTTAAFPQDVCACCGCFIEHAPWCIMPGPRRS